MDFEQAVVIADLEAGLGTLTRVAEEAFDIVLVVVEPTAKSLEVGQRAAESAMSGGHGGVVVVANRVRDAEDSDRVRSVFGDHRVITVPDDEAIVAAEREGFAPLDVAPEAPAVIALVDLARQLMP